jgi:hypothetical protein
MLLYPYSHIPTYHIRHIWLSYPCAYALCVHVYSSLRTNGTHTVLLSIAIELSGNVDLRVIQDMQHMVVHIPHVYVSVSVSAHVHTH